MNREKKLEKKADDLLSMQGLQAEGDQFFHKYRILRNKTNVV